jgi:beta-lactamase class A
VIDGYDDSRRPTTAVSVTNTGHDITKPAMLNRRTVVSGVAATAAAGVIAAPAGAGPAPVPTAFRRSHAVDQDAAAGMAVDSLLLGEPGVYGVLMMTPAGDVLVSRNPNAPFISASLYKLIVMLDYFVSEAQGLITFDQTLELLPEYFPADDEQDDPYWGPDSVGSQVPIIDLVETMIAYTSNVAARALLSYTTTENLNWLAQTYGMTSTYVLCTPSETNPWPPVMGDGDTPGSMEQALRFVLESATDGPVNITCARDIAHFFSELANGRLVNAEASDGMRRILAQQQINDRIPYLLPPGTACAHKTGNLDQVNHDAGIVAGQRGDTITVLLSQAYLEDDRVTQLLQRLGLIAYGSLDVPPMP